MQDDADDGEREHSNRDGHAAEDEITREQVNAGDQGVWPGHV